MSLRTSSLSALLLWACGLLPVPALAGERVALVIGNGAYKFSMLTETVTDARAVKGQLEAFGFSVIYRENIKKNDAEAVLNEFQAGLKPGAEALFYYAGHALQINGTNYLCPVDAVAESGRDILHQCMNLNDVLGIMSRAGTRPNLVLVDASRKSPFPRKVHRGVHGLALVRAPAETLISFANAPGRINQHYLYTGHLLQAMREADISVSQALQRLGRKVAKASKGQQSPWLTGRIDGDFRFVSGLSAGSGVNKPAPEAAMAKSPAHGDVMTEPVANMEFIYIRPGTFMMGSPETELNRYDDEQQHNVTINHGFWIGKFEVTFDQYDAFCKATRHPRPMDEQWGRGSRPVINISWFDAAAYANWLSGQTGRHYRLPTEAEWEYAARAGTTTAYSFGDNPDDFADYAWNGAGAGRQTHPVGSKKPNPWGLHDVHGNVWEWTASIYNEDYDGSELRDDSLDSTHAKRAVRGGAWYFFPKGMRSADRRIYNPENRFSYIGFRLVREE